MLKLEFESAIVKIYSHEPSQYIFIEYLEPTVHAEIVTVWKTVLFILEVKKYTAYILDARRLGALSQQSTVYINSTVLPQLADLGVKKAAIIIPKNAFDKMISEIMVEEIETETFVERRIFNGIEEAEAWVTL